MGQLIGTKKVNRVLWLTDTYDDHNGVSMVLQAMRREITARNLPVDFMVCSNTLKSGKNLIVIKPLSEFNIPLYRQQPMRIPNFLTIQRIFRKKKYDRVICST
ncbi:MAG: glycosyl transferase family 1, partial [Bacteroidota bacterium]